MSIKFSPHYQGFAIIHGYISSMINREKKIEDEEVREYFEKRVNRILKSVMHK